jgi:NADPH:quinone reductase-like Zn-dependent oxidoreductase
VGLTKPRQKNRIAGADGAGTVEAVGANVNGLGPGDEVLGWFRGSFAEYAHAAADRVVPKPARLTFEQAAAVTMAGETALHAIRDVGQVQAGHRVLINGFAGGVGTFAVQIRAQPLRRDPRQRGQSAAAPPAPGADPDRNPCLQRRRLTRSSVRRDSGILGVVIVNGVVRQRLRPLPDTWSREHLLTVTELVDAGKLTPVLDRTYPLADTAAGLRHVEAGHARGKVVITVTSAGLI